MADQMPSSNPMVKPTLVATAWNRQATVPDALTGGVVAGGGSALLGILVSNFPGDVPTSTLYVGTGASAVPGAVGSVIGRLIKGRSAN